MNDVIETLERLRAMSIAAVGEDFASMDVDDQQAYLLQVSLLVVEALKLAKRSAKR